MLIKVNACIKVYDNFEYLILFGLAQYDVIYDRIRYLLSLKVVFT